MINETLYWECGICKHKFWKTPHNMTRSIYGGCPNCLSIRNMPKSHIDLLHYIKTSNDIISTQDMTTETKYNYNKTARIKAILERKKLIRKYKYFFRNPRCHGYKISSKGLRTLELSKILKDDRLY
jgi:hypothetical protein